MIVSLLVLAVILLVYYWYKRPFNAPPGPRGLPLLGVIPFLTQRPEIKFFEWSKKYGPVMSVRIGQKDWIVLNSASSIKEAFIKHGAKLTERPPNYVMDKMLNTEKSGIVYSGNGQWQALRKFGEVTLRNLGVGKSSFESTVMNAIDFLIRDINHQSHQLYDIRCGVSEAIHRIMCVVLFGEDARYTLPKSAYDYLEDPRKAMVFNMSILLPFLRFVPSVAKVLLDATKEGALHHKTYASLLVDKERYSTFDDSSSFVDAFAREKKAESETLGSNLHFTEKQFAYYAGDMFVAGIHTTASGIAWCFLGLLHHPYCQEKIRSEINKVIGIKKPYIAARNSMPFTMAYLQEILRCCTLTPLAIPHCSREDVDIGGYRIIKGSQVMINIWSAHNDPSVFENPEVFRPERFLDENGNFMSSKNVIPFSVGPRHCMGEQLARMEMFLFLVSILQKFRVSRDETSDVPKLNDGVLGIVYLPKPYKIFLDPL